MIGIDPLLVALGKVIDASLGETVSSCADDIAMVVSSPDRMCVVHEIFSDCKRAAALSLNMKKTVFVPIVSGCARAAAAEIRAGLVGSPWKDVVVDTSAILIGIHIGPRGASTAATPALKKFATRSREIANLGFPPEASIALARVLATPVLHHVGQFHTLPAGADAVAQISSQGLLHLPHHGFARLILRNLSIIGLPDLVPVDLAVRGIALSAARRFAAYAATCLTRLTLAFNSSDLRPLASLSRRAPRPADWFIPIGWDGPAFAATIVSNAGVLATLGVSRAPRSAALLSRSARLAPSLANFCVVSPSGRRSPSAARLRLTISPIFFLRSPRLQTAINLRGCASCRTRGPPAVGSHTLTLHA